MAVYLIRCHLRASAGARLAVREAPDLCPCPRKQDEEPYEGEPRARKKKQSGHTARKVTRKKRRMYNERRALFGKSGATRSPQYVTDGRLAAQ